ncbi:unnamed protein product, partial [marine sediment metagenome]
RVGVPTIGVCVAKNQLENVKEWGKTGFLENIGWYNKDNIIARVDRLLKHLENIKLRKTKSKIGKNFVDGKGSLRIVKTLLSKLFRNKLVLRKASYEDALEIFNLSNDDLVRYNSYTPEKIEWEHHLKWLKDKVEDKNCIFFIIVDNLNKFLGQVRFDINPENKEAIINISLQKNIRGLGLSSFIIDKSVNKLLKIKSIKLIKAYIKDENIPSIKSFEKANFTFFGRSIIKGNKSKVYIKKV